MSTLLKITTVEAKLFLRDLTSALITVGLPIVLLVVFGSIVEADDDPSDGVGIEFIPAMALTLSLAMLGFSVLPTVLATYREKGILRRLATTPVHPGKLLFAQLLVNLAVGLVVATIMVAISALAFDIGVPGNLLAFVVAFVLATAALFTIGLLIAAVAGTGKAATSIGMLLFFPSLFFAGVWTPGDLMPGWARPIRDVSPLGAGLKAVQDAWAGSWPDAVSLIALTVVAAGAGYLAARLFRWE